MICWQSVCMFTLSTSSPHLIFSAKSQWRVYKFATDGERWLKMTFDEPFEPTMHVYIIKIDILSTAIHSELPPTLSSRAIRSRRPER